MIAPVLVPGMLGCYRSPEFVRPSTVAVSKAVPAGWAMQALKNMIVYNQDFGAVYLPAAVLLLMGIVFLGLAVQLGERA